MRRLIIIYVATGWMVCAGYTARAAVLWNHPGIVLVSNTNVDILKGVVEPRNTNSSGTLYFRVLADPIADTASKVVQTFEAGFMLVEGGREHLGIGNSEGAMAYSALNVPKAPKGFQDLNSAVPDPPFVYEYMRAGSPRYLVLKVEYVPNHDARVTAWLNPDLSFGATEFDQPTNSVVHFETDATFDEIRLMHRGYGSGWKFSQMMVATSFEDLLQPHFWQRRWFIVALVLGALLMVAASVRLMERRRSFKQIQVLEKEQAVADERARIARDIHDEVGSGLTKISKLTEMVQGAASTTQSQQVVFHDISEATRDTIQTMDEIVWAINPKNDTLKEAASYLVFFAEDFLRPTGIACILDVALNLPDRQVSAEVRHNLFMGVKEAFNNAVKHSQCSQIRLKLQLEDENKLAVEIKDDGKGFDPDKVGSEGNGLENMRRRLRDVGGDFVLKTGADEGTLVRLVIPLLEHA